MNARPRNRQRGLMDDTTLRRSLHWTEKLLKPDALALHVFGEPLLHPLFDLCAKEFAKLCPITMSTNGVTLDEKWADRLAEIPWSWISVSTWKEEKAEKAARLLIERGIKVEFPGKITHNWAGQSKGPAEKLFKECPFLRDETAIVRWNGDITTCCITDRPEDVIGHVDKEPSEVSVRGYSLCDTCHHKQ